MTSSTKKNLHEKRSNTVPTVLTATDAAGKFLEITGVILAGGKSTRMGADKAFLMLNGQHFITLLIEKFKQLFQTVFIVADEREKFALAGVPVVQDVFKDCGPLGGIHSALLHSATPHIFVAPCDTPLLSTELIQFLITSAKPNEITVGTANGRIHPLLGIYPLSSLRIIEEHLNKGKRKVLDVLNDVPTAILNLSPWSNELSNINDPALYEQAVKQH